MSSFKNLLGTLTLLAAVTLLIAAMPTQSYATSQWAKKYETSCTTCHTAFPRLNYYGERFMRNGYQDPDANTPDGGTLGKTGIDDGLDLEDLSHIMGVRMSVTPLRSETNKLTVDGETQSNLYLGDVDWYQFFFAGTINKNISVFVETENSNDKDGGEFDFNWFHLGFQNLGDSPWLNFWVGKVSALDFTSYSNRLRQIGAVKADVFGMKTSNGGSPEDAQNASSARNGIMWYGGKGPVVLSAGVSGGSHTPDKNDQLKTWGAVRLEIPGTSDSPLVGSNISFWYDHGKDAANTATAQVVNKFNRMSVQGNLRYETWDLQLAYLTTTEDNYNLDTTNVEETWGGMVAQLGYLSGPWYLSFLYDTVTYDNEAFAGMERSHFTPSISYFILQNLRAEAHVRMDQTDEDNGYVRSDDWRLNIRTMF